MLSFTSSPIATTLLAVSLCQVANAYFLLPTPVQALQPRQTQAVGTPLYLDMPACDSYQCAVTFFPGDNATAHWLDAPQGNVILTMVSRTDNITDQPVATVPGTTTNCNTEGQSSCGQFSWIVPSAWVGGNFTLQATSASDTSITSFTDTILVMARAGNSTIVPFQALDPVASNSTSSSMTGPSSATTTAPGISTTATPATSTSSRPTSSSSPSSNSNAASNLKPIHAYVTALSLIFALAAVCL